MLYKFEYKIFHQKQTNFVLLLLADKIFYSVYAIQYVHNRQITIVNAIATSEIYNDNLYSVKEIWFLSVII